MSNEELCILISSGKKELLKDLYMQNRGIIYRYVNSFYRRHGERCRRCGIEKEDFESEAFFALCEAVESFFKSKEYKFTSYLRYPLKNRFNELIGYRTRRILKEPLNNYVSLDMEIDNGEDTDTTLKDLIYDPESEFEEKLIENCAYSGIYPAVKATIKDDFIYDCIDMNYRQGISQQKIAEKYGYSNTYISSVIRQGLKKLRKRPNTPFKRACQDVVDLSYRKNGVARFKNTGTSSTEWAALQMIK